MTHIVRYRAAYSTIMRSDKAPDLCAYYTSVMILECTPTNRPKSHSYTSSNITHPTGPVSVGCNKGHAGSVTHPVQVCINTFYEVSQRGIAWWCISSECDPIIKWCMAAKVQSTVIKARKEEREASWCWAFKLHLKWNYCMENHDNFRYLL